MARRRGELRAGLAPSRHHRAAPCRPIQAPFVVQPNSSLFRRARERRACASATSFSGVPASSCARAKGHPPPSHSKPPARFVVREGEGVEPPDPPPAGRSGMRDGSKRLLLVGFSRPLVSHRLQTVEKRRRVRMRDGSKPILLVGFSRPLVSHRLQTVEKRRKVGISRLKPGFSIDGFNPCVGARWMNPFEKPR